MRKPAASAAGRLLNSRIRNRRGGRKPIQHPCPYCGKRLNTTQVLGHLKSCKFREQKPFGSLPRWGEQQVSRSIRGTYKAGHIRPLEPLDLPEDTPVRITVEQKLARHEAAVDPLAKLWEIAEDLGPPDLASNLDRYIYGSARR